MIKKFLIIISVYNCFLLITYSQYKINIIFRIDDYGIDNQEFYPEIFDVFKKYKVKLVVSVVPFKLKNNKLSKLTERQKEILINGLNNKVIELAQHGFSHAKRNYPPSEFNGLSFSVQYEKIKVAKDYLEKEFDIKLNTFVPPFNTYDKTTLMVLDSLGFKSISAALYNIPESSKNKLNYIPYTTTLEDLNRSINNARMNKNNHDIVIVVMMHNKEFIENDSIYINSKGDLEYKTALGRHNLRYLASELMSLNSQKDIVITTFDDLKIDTSLLKYYRFNQNIEDYFLKILPFMQFKVSGFYPEYENEFEAILKYKVYPLAIYILLFSFGSYLGFSHHKYIKRIFSINLRLYVSSLLILFVTFLIIFIYLGSLKLMFIDTSLGYFLVNFILDLKTRLKNNYIMNN